MTGKKILIVEDHQKTADLLSDYLSLAGLNVSILNRGDLVIPHVRANPPDLIILEVILPEKDGLTVCMELRTFSSVPILILTARAEEIDRILGLELGADDYMCKPFSPKEVVARVKAILRRTLKYNNENIITAGPIVLEEENHIAKIKEKDLHLTLNEFELLKLLASCPKRPFSRIDIISNIRGYNSDKTRVIDCHIKNLRRKINQALPGKSVIQTLYGRGYYLNVS